jgi:hypothetical protein
MYTIHDPTEMGNVPGGFRRLNNPRMNSLLCLPVQILNLFKTRMECFPFLLPSPSSPPSFASRHHVHHTATSLPFCTFSTHPGKSSECNTKVQMTRLQLTAPVLNSELSTRLATATTSCSHSNHPATSINCGDSIQ